MAALMISMFFMVINYLSSDTQFVYANSNRIFVYISNGGDGNIAVMKLNRETGDLTMVEKVPAGPNVMHMALSPIIVFFMHLFVQNLFQ